MSLKHISIGENAEAIVDERGIVDDALAAGDGAIIAAGTIPELQGAGADGGRS